MAHLLACGPEEAPLRTLTVNAPVAGAVSVGQRSIQVTPYADAYLSVTGDTVTVSLETPSEIVTVQGVTSSVLDFAPFLGQPQLFGDQEETVRFEAVGAADAVAVTPVRTRSPRREGDTFVVEVPRGEPVVLVARWRDEGGGQRLGWLRTDDVATWLGTTLTVAPSVTSDGVGAIQTDAPSAAWLRAELVIDRLRTGIVLAEGRVSSRAARAVPRFVGDGAAALTVWADVSARGLGGQVIARTSALLAADVDEAVLPWPGELALQPGPRDPLAALPLLSAGNGWDIDGAEGSTWLEVELTAVGGCASHAWRVFARPGDRIDLPAGTPADVLGAPLIHGRISAVTVSGYVYDDLVGTALGGRRLMDSVGAPGTAGLWHRRSVAGYWRGDVERCDTLYEPDLFGAYERGAECVAGGSAATVLRDRCGALVNLSDPVSIACSVPTALGLASISGAAVGFESDGDTGWVVTQGGRVFDLAPFPEAEATAPMGWTGPYARYRVVDQLAYGDASGIGDPLTPPFVVETGDASQGPWAHLGADGELAVTTQTARFSVFLSDFDGVTGLGRQGAPACVEAGAVHRLTMEAGELVLEVRLPGPAPDQIRVRRMVFTR